MEIINCGCDYRHPSDFIINRPNGSGDWLFLLVRSPAFFVFNGHKFEARENSVVVFKKGTPQLYGANNGEFINDWVHFNAEPYEIEAIENSGIVLDEILKFRNVSEISNLMKHISFEKYSNNKNSMQSAELYFRLILLKLSDLKAQSASKYSHLTNELNELRNQIYANPQKNRKIDEIARELSVSTSYLQHQYKFLFRNGIKKDIILSRLEYSKYLLINTDYTISVISRLCGYENDVHYMRIFKKENGITPTEYRNSLHSF